MNIVETHELTKVFQPRRKKGAVVALDGVSLAIQQGEIFGLLGPNGAGKTTFFKVLLGITKITQGDVLLFGLPPDDPQSRQKVGYLPESHRFPDHLTGLGLLEFTGRLCGMTTSEIDARTDGLLELVDMDKWANVKIKRYSKGMLQRIGLAQSMISDPDLLLLDEPTDGIDPVGKVEIRDVLIRIRNEGKTIILNSHLLSEVESAADRVAILSRGKVARIGTVDELTSRKSQFEIEGDFASKLVSIPEEIGRKLSISSNRLIVELVEDSKINNVIDLLRSKRISIRAVQPLKVSLEQSFIETVTQPGEKKA